MVKNHDVAVYVKSLVEPIIAFSCSTDLDEKTFSRTLEDAMGGYGSGGKKTSYYMDDCITIDTAQFKQYLRTPNKIESHLTLSGGPIQKHCPSDAIPGVAYCVERFEKQIDSEPLCEWPIHAALTLDYVAIAQGEKESCHIWIPMTPSTCHFNRGLRWWFVTPCCGRRARAVFLTPQYIYPLCYKCGNIHYASQTSSDIERQIVYEKYLLSNYGYTWAHHKYHSLKEHYFKITPEYRAKMDLSQRQRELVLLQHLITFERAMVKTHLHAIKSLKSDEDKQLYLELIAEENGTSYALDLVKMLGISIKFEKVIRETTNTSIISQYYPDDTVEQTLPAQEYIPDEDELNTRRLKLMAEREKDLSQEIKHLEKLAA